LYHYKGAYSFNDIKSMGYFTFFRRRNNLIKILKAKYKK